MKLHSQTKNHMSDYLMNFVFCLAYFLLLGPLTIILGCFVKTDLIKLLTFRRSSKICKAFVLNIWFTLIWCTGGLVLISNSWGYTSLNFMEMLHPFMLIFLLSVSFPVLGKEKPPDKSIK